MFEFSLIRHFDFLNFQTQLVLPLFFEQLLRKKFYAKILFITAHI